MIRNPRTMLSLGRGRSLLLAPLALLAGCAMGPQHPTTPVAMAPPPVEQTIQPTSGPAQIVRPGLAVDPHWWTAFRSPAVDALVAQALKSNNDLATAEATLRQAQELAKSANGARAPQIDLRYNAERDRTSDALANVLNDPERYLYTLHTAQLSVSYPLDLFGGLKSQARSARAQADVASHRLDAARTMVVANLVTALVQHASLNAQLDAATTSVQNGRAVLKLLERRRELGDIGDADVAAQQNALATVEGVIPALTRARDHQRVVIAAMIGIAPGSALPDLPALSDFTLPTDLPVALPADLIANRPDVAAAEAQMRGAGADVGTAIAARLPLVQLTAVGGGSAPDFGKMFASGNPFWQLLGSVVQPLFHGKQLVHQQKAAEAALDAAKAGYRQAALVAFGEVSDALTGLRTDGDALDAATRANDAASRNLRYTQTQLKLGSVGTMSLLNASNSAAQASGQLVQAQAARLVDTVALFQAVGGHVATD
jgi:NodT family efflux transporter outer membrane factor (OMF) lipoprotein